MHTIHSFQLIYIFLQLLYFPLQFNMQGFCEGFISGLGVSLLLFHMWALDGAIQSLRLREVDWI